MLKTIIKIPTLLLGLLLLFSCGTAQEVSYTNTGKIYKQNEVNKTAEFEGGKQHLIQFLSTNLIYPAAAIENNVQGRVIIRFVVEDNGTINNFEILKDIGEGCGNEIVRVLQKTQARWSSAKVDNKRVRSYYILNVIFRIPSDNSKPYIQGDTI